MLMPPVAHRLEEDGGAEREDGSVVRFGIERRIYIILYIRSDGCPLGYAECPVGFEHGFGAVRELGADGFGAEAVIGGGKADLVKRIAVERVVIDRAQNIGAFDSGG